MNGTIKLERGRQDFSEKLSFFIFLNQNICCGYFCETVLLSAQIICYN